MYLYETIPWLEKRGQKIPLQTPYPGTTARPRVGLYKGEPLPGLQMHPFYSPFLMVTGNQGFDITACIRVFIWTPSGRVHGIQLRSPTVNRLIWQKKKQLFLKRFQLSFQDGKQPRDKKPRSQRPLLLVPGKETTQRTLGTTLWDKHGKSRHSQRG